jgi:hypothetical protein
MLGIDFVDFGGIRRLVKINLVHPTIVPTAMILDLQVDPIL